MAKYDLSTIRHSAAHVMAHAVKKLFPEAKVTIGPSIEDGFYYDFDVPKPFTPEDLENISAEMENVIAEGAQFVRKEISREEALEMFKDEPYKLELINDLPEDEVISIYEEGDFVDLCRGPHTYNTKDVKAFKLLSAAGAYWRGDEKNPMLQRIYGTAFGKKSELDEYLERIAEAERRDHRKLGRELDLFSIQEEAGPGLVFWHPKGALVRKNIEDYWRAEHYDNGYEMVFTPHIARQELWKTSGHLDFFTDNIFQPMEVEGQPYLIRPMNCPFHLLIYKSRVRSYRELPIRWAELGTVYRYERSGVLHGLMRVRGFTQDDAHIICTRDQVHCETRRVLDFVLKILRRFGFIEYEVYLSTMPEKHVGDDEVWEQATEALKAALEDAGLEYKVDEGGGAFYGPKIDVKIKDAIGRVWQCSTIQVDFNEPERFDITYIGQDNQQHRPIMIHRALLGSLERFMGVLIEHYAGAFLLWLAPVQAVVIPIADRHNEYAETVKAKLRAEGFRVEVDDRNEKTGYKIREAQMQKIPYMLVVGDREAEAGEVSVRSRTEGDKGAIVVDKVVKEMKAELDA
ncbi:MAG: threonine--tRNA ligase [Armatimonadetes bacterium]|nr:threonine--tRNA ligase [Armatimonadota bacterium]